jgi:hypothetical protein
LRDAIKDRKYLKLVDSREDAQITLVVMGRSTAGVTAGFMGTAARDRSIVVKFICCDSVETEMSASAQGGTIGSGGSWGKAAGKISKQVDEWVDANRARLTAAPK